MGKNYNHQISMKLREMADILSLQNANAFRISAYLKAADTVGGYPIDLSTILENEGIDGLIRIPSIGRGIATAIHEIITSGRWAQLERLRGTLEPERLFQSLPGIGPTLAQRIHDELNIDTLEELEQAAFDGRLKTVPGISQRRLAAVTPALAAVLGRRRQRLEQPSTEIPIGQLLALDRLYRDKAAVKELPLIAPKRFNASNKAWLPIMHATEEPWHFTLMYSNTARAHQLKRNLDWVVIYYYGLDHIEGQHTIVTETHGVLTGSRVVRGREDECRAFYQEQAHSLNSRASN